MHDTEIEEQTIVDPDALTVQELSEIQNEIEEQPHWRHIADKEMDYADGNQLDADLLVRMKSIGIPPAIEDQIGPALLSVQGFELKTRTDWRVTPNGEPDGQDVADALNYKLNQAERQSKADKACSMAFRPQIACGVGVVEVKRESDPFKYPYRCVAVNRNEIHWDMKSQENDLSDARWLRRTRWIHPDRLVQSFPEHEELLKTIGRYGGSWWDEIGIDGGSSTGLQGAWQNSRAWTHSERHWYDPTSKEVNVSELWYRRWKSTLVLIFKKDGRVVEYDEDNHAHNIALAQNIAKVERRIVSKVRRSYWVGPHCLHDGPTPYSHHYFPYVLFIGFREDNTGVPYGLVRHMKYNQDSINSGISKMRWGMTVSRVERTAGAIAMPDDTFRRTIARPDADIVLDQKHMAKPGAVFKVVRDYELTQQHFQLLNDARNSIVTTSGITSGFQGRAGTARSGRQEEIQVDQSNQTLESLMDNFRESRQLMGEMLLSMIIEDIGGEEEVVVIEGDAVTADRTVIINKPETDERGYPYLSNDIQRTRLKVALEEVPSTASYKGQQLNAMSEMVKSLPAQYQAAVLPYMTALMDIPNKRDVIEAIRNAAETSTPEQIEQRVKQAVEDALAKAAHDLKERELEIKEKKVESEIRSINANANQTGVQAAYASMQAANQIAMNPQIAPIADAIMQGAGYQTPRQGDDPDFPIPTGNVVQQPNVENSLPGVQENTSPSFPPVPQQAPSAMQGIETPSMQDNLG